MNKLLTSAILNSYRPKKDKSVSITFELDEKTAQQIGEIHSITGNFGYLLFKSEEQLTTSEIKEIEELDTEITGKTKAQRLRNVLHVLWNQEGEGEFKDFYSEKMEKLIEFYKDKLDDR